MTIFDLFYIVVAVVAGGFTAAIVGSWLAYALIKTFNWVTGRRVTMK